MEEKNMINDIIEGYKGVLKNFDNAILECRNMELRQLFQNQRNSYESFQYEITRLAESKGYYLPDIPASQNEINNILKEFSE